MSASPDHAAAGPADLVTRRPAQGAAPRLAATVLLLRERGSVEVLLTHRSAELSAMGGVWVFPGGKLDAADCGSAALRRVATGDAAASARAPAVSAGRPLAPEEAIGLRVAACRETFEETGVLLARGADGCPCSPEVVRRLLARHSNGCGSVESFAELLAGEGLFIDAADLVHWANWITPSGAPVRFDTAFFAAAAPEDQPVSLGAAEVSRARWLRPADALLASERGELPLLPPTVTTLRELAALLEEHRGLAALLRAESGRAVAPVLPRIDRGDDGRIVVVLPWDPGYGGLRGEGGPPDAVYPATLRRLPSRVVVPKAPRQSEQTR